MLTRRVGGPTELDALGTCFAFRHKTHILTAAHCVGVLADDEVVVLGAGKGDFLIRPARAIHRHPTADIALVEVENSDDDPAEPFWDFVGNYGMGEDFLAFGWPEDVFGENARKPVARLFKGSYQRFMKFKSHMGFEYLAGELSIGCPGGLSGGPLFRPGAAVMLTGLVTENHETTTLLHSVEEVQEDGNVTRIRNQSVINYGVALMLNDVADWLNALVPARTK